MEKKNILIADDEEMIVNKFRTERDSNKEGGAVKKQPKKTVADGKYGRYIQAN